MVVIGTNELVVRDDRWYVVMDLEPFVLSNSALSSARSTLRPSFDEITLLHLLRCIHNEVSRATLAWLQNPNVSSVGTPVMFQFAG